MIIRFSALVAATMLAVTSAGGCSVSSTDEPPIGEASRAAERQSTDQSVPASPERMFAGTGQEWDQTMRDCMVQGGWPAVDNGDGTVTWAGSEQNPKEFEDAYVRCEAEVGTPPAPPLLSDAQYSVMYQYMVETRACLTNLGYSISEPPTVDQWIDGYRASYEN